MDAIRGVPLIVLAYFVFFGIPAGMQGMGMRGFRLSALQAGTIALSLNCGAYMAEIIRAGIESVDRGQMEASRSLGLSYGSSMALVVVPQAVRTMIPSIINQFIITLKDTSLSLIHILEVAGKSMQADFEPVFERKFHNYLNCIEGVMHTGQRDMIRIRVSKNAFDAGFRAKHIGEVLYARIKNEFDAVVDKCQVKVITDPELCTKTVSYTHLVLGVEAAPTLGEIREEIAKAETAGSNPIPKGMSKQDYAELKFGEALSEQDDYDLLVMGHTQGKGCYCFVNGLLTTQIARYAKNYKYIVVDNEAGMEHISRGILPSVDTIILVSDCSRRGVQAVGRIAKLIPECRCV